MGRHAPARHLLQRHGLPAARAPHHGRVRRAPRDRVRAVRERHLAAFGLLKRAAEQPVTAAEADVVGALLQHALLALDQNNCTNLVGQSHHAPLDAPDALANVPELHRTAYSHKFVIPPHVRAEPPSFYFILRQNHSPLPYPSCADWESPPPSASRGTAIAPL